MELLGDDLEFRDERVELKPQTVKKHFSLKIKPSSNLLCNNSNNNTNINNNNNNNNQTPTINSNHNNQSFPIDNLNSNYPTHKLNDQINVNTYQNINDDQNLRINNNKQPINDFCNYNRNHIISNLNWNLNLNSLSQKIIDQKMDYCMLCCLPILVYGRLLPCKHVLCIQCAQTIGLKTCIKETCQENIERIEKVSKGQLFICNYDQEITNTNMKEKFLYQPDISQKNKCGRSYMSQRDLDAHIRHRHDPNLNMNDHELMQT